MKCTSDTLEVERVKPVLNTLVWLVTEIHQWFIDVLERA